MAAGNDATAMRMDSAQVSSRDGAPIELLATCTFGLESVVTRELEVLGYAAKPVSTGRIAFSGDLRAICRANLWLRAADRVLIQVGQFPVGGGDAGFDALFEGVRSLPWERWIARTAAFPVSGRCVRSQLMSEPAVQRATKKAIVDRLRSAYGLARDERPGPGSGLPETEAKVAVEVSILKDVATLTIDTSGAGLHKRGYREGTPGEAALKETLAAGLVLLSVWRPGRALVDPFCGSGTIAIEAALIGRNIAPGLAGGGREFESEHWEGPGGSRILDVALWAVVREEARAAVKPEFLPIIHASDISEGALRLARMNAKAAGVERQIHFARRDFKELSSKLEYGCVVTNPPYGVRLGEEKEIAALYRAMPAVFRKLPTWSFHILTGMLDLESIFGQAAARRRKLYNSKIETTYFTFLGPRPPRADDDSEADVQHREHGGKTEEGRREEEVAEGEVESVDGVVDRVHVRAGDDEKVVPAGELGSEAAEPVAVARSARAPVGPAFGGLRERDTKEAGEFAACLANNLRHLRKYPARGIHCYRIYERDVPDVPLIVDRYGDYFHAAEYEREHSRTAAQQADWFDLMRETIAKAGGVPVANVFMKEKHRQRGLAQHEKQGDAGRTIVVHEGTPPLKFEVNLSDYIDTGLFLDHRLTRQMVREQSAGKNVLNLFSYTGSFTVYAAGGGATATTSVDLSNTYSEWAERNMAINGLGGAQHRFVRSDVLEFLRTLPRGRHAPYDLVIVDPPTFSNSKSTMEDWEVARSHPEMFALLAPLLSPGATVYFSTNYRRFKLDEGALADSGLGVREISRQTVPPEYRNRRIHRCWRMKMVGVEEAVAEFTRRRETAPPEPVNQLDDDE